MRRRLPSSSAGWSTGKICLIERSPYEHLSVSLRRAVAGLPQSIVSGKLVMGTSTPIAFADTVGGMSAPIAERDAATSGRRRVQLTPIAILLLGVVIVPIAFSVAFNSWGPLTEESAIRMAFATVAGQVIAVLTGSVMVGLAAKRRYGFAQIVVLIVIALAITINSSAMISSAGELLLSRLDLIAETDMLNQ